VVSVVIVMIAVVSVIVSVSVIVIVIVNVIVDIIIVVIHVVNDGRIHRIHGSRADGDAAKSRGWSRYRAPCGGHEAGSSHEHVIWVVVYRGQETTRLVLSSTTLPTN